MDISWLSLRVGRRVLFGHGNIPKRVPRSAQDPYTAERVMFEWKLLVYEGLLVVSEEGQ